MTWQSHISPIFQQKHNQISLTNPNPKIPVCVSKMDDDKNRNLESDLMTDPPIKLFGKSIQLPETSAVEHEQITSYAEAADDDVGERRSCGMDSGLEDESADVDTLSKDVSEREPETGNPMKANQQDGKSGTNEILENPIDQSKATTLPSPRTEDNTDIALPQEKTLKKPDKIIPCPRCDSMDTKFCYFNNYNVNQPRYFCRKCQRYWTSGGTVRNLPVGAGRRKSKSSAVQYPTVAVHSDFPSSPTPHFNGIVHRPVALNGSVLSFAHDQHPCQISPQNIVNVARQASIQNGSSNPVVEAGIVVDTNVTGSAESISNVENEDEYKEKSHTAQSYQCLQPQMLCYPAPLWPPYPWNPAQFNYPLPAPINIQPGFPMPFYPAPMYMGCAVPGAWNMPWTAPSPSPNSQPDPKSLTLGKRSREDNVTKPSNVAGDNQQKDESSKPSIWVPKTLRIDDLEEAAKSSMWATLGIKTDNTVSTGGKGHLKPFSSLTSETNRVVTTSSALLANPAALSRSMNFHEGS